MILAYLLSQVISVTLSIPVVMARIVQLHPLIVIMAVIVGTDLMGPVGTLIAISLTAIPKVLLEESYPGIKSLRH